VKSLAKTQRKRVTLPHDITLNECRTLEDILGGRYVHKKPPDTGAFYEDDEPQYAPGDWKPNCREAYQTIHNAISTVLRPSTILRYECREELYVEITSQLVSTLRRVTRPRRTKTHRITSEKFLQSENRGGWLYLFAVNVARHWIARRIREAKGDKRVREYLELGAAPKETFTSEQGRTIRQAESLSYDRWQFDGGRGHAPDSMTILSDRPDHRLVEYGRHSDAEMAAAIREEISRLPQDDQDFFWAYLEGKYARGWTAAERKRFQRLRERVRKAMSQTH
jgi:hypothetical protein